MRGSRVLAVACLLALATPLWAEGPVIDHSAVACMVAEKFPQLEARIVEPEMISRARVQFRGERGPWYFVEMKRSGGVFTGLLPKPKKSLKTIRYYIEATDRQFRVNRTQEFAASVVPEPMMCADKKMMAGVAAAPASLIVGGPSAAAAVPAGFSSSGVVAAPAATAAGASAGAAGGGGIGTAAVVGIVAGGAAIAGVAVAAGGGGNEAGSSATGPSSSSSAAAGKWIGTSPDGMIIDVINGQCPRAFDVEFNFTSKTSGEIGTATTRLRETPCADVFNSVHSYSLTKGNVTADSIAFDFGSGAYHFTGTFTGSRMTGSFSITEFPQSGHFIATKQ